MPSAACPLRSRCILSVSYPRIVALQPAWANAWEQLPPYFQYPILGSWHCNHLGLGRGGVAVSLSVSYPRIVALQLHEVNYRDGRTEFFQYPILGSWHCNIHSTGRLPVRRVLSVSYPRIVALQLNYVRRCAVVDWLSVSYPRIVALQPCGVRSKTSPKCSFSILSSDRGIATSLSRVGYKLNFCFQYPILGSWHCNVALP